MLPVLRNSLYVGIAGAALLCVPTAAQPAKRPQVAAAIPALTGAKVVEMVKRRLPQDLIVSTITGSGKRISLTAEDLIALQDLGAGPEIFVALGAAPPSKTPAPVLVPITLVRADLDSLPTIPRPARKRVVAVEPLDFKGVVTQSQKLFGHQSTIPDAIAVMMMHRMAASNEFLMVERPKLEGIQKEIDKGQTIPIRRGTGPRMGRLLGAEALLVGEVTQLSYETTTREIGPGRVCGIIRLPGCEHTVNVRIWEKAEAALVGVTFRLLDVETGAVLHSGEALGRSGRKSRQMTSPAGAKSTTIANIHETILAEAVTKALDELGAGIAAAAPTLNARELEIEARVADFSSAKIIIAAGQFAAVTVGDRFLIERINGEIKDPATGQVIGLSTDKVGEMVVSATRERFAEGPWIGSMEKSGQFLVRLSPANLSSKR